MPPSVPDYTLSKERPLCEMPAYNLYGDKCDSEQLFSTVTA